MRILHFSDFHLTKEGLNAIDSTIDRMSKALLPVISADGIKIDLILFTGDMVDQGGRSFGSLSEGLKDFHDKFMLKLCEKLDVQPQSVYVCPGNHDLNRNLIDKATDYKLEQDLTTPDALHQFLISESLNPGFSERLREYDIAYRQNWLKEVSPHHATTVKLADHFIVDIDGRKIGISCLNSAWRCGSKLAKQEINEELPRRKKLLKPLLSRMGFEPKTDKRTEYATVDKEYNRALIGNAQITDADTFFGNGQVSFRISLAHHHFCLLGPADQHDFDRVLRRHYDISFFGHTHFAKTDQYTNDAGSLVCAIAPSTKRDNEHTSNGDKNGFSLWDIDIAKGMAREHRYFLEDGSEFRQDNNYNHTYYIAGQLIESLDEFMKDLQNAIDIDSEELEKFRNSIVNSEADVNLIYGVPGIGKTYQLTKALRQSDPNGVYYCEARLDNDGKFLPLLERELQAFFSSADHKCLIFDNCNVESLSRVVKLRDAAHSAARIYGLTNEYDERTHRYSGFRIFDLTPGHSKGAVENYIDSHVTDYKIRDSIKRYSSGFPIIAIKLVGEFQKSGSPDLTPHSVGIHTLLSSFGKDVKDSKDLEELLIAMSLFQPFPKLKDDSMAIWRMKSLSRLHSRSRDEIVSLIERARRIWHGTLIESTPAGYTIRPYILAVHLASIWFENHTADEDFTSLIEDLGRLEDGDRARVVAALSRRLSDLNKSDAARKLFERLNSSGGFFRSENVVLSQLGSQLILAAADVNPAPLARSLKDVITQAPAERLTESGWLVRRNLVSALTKLVYYKESFDDAMMAMGILSFYENEENILNNASSTFESTFHLFLPGTEASTAQRFEWLSRAIAADSRIYSLLPLAMKGAFAFGMFSRVGSIGPDNEASIDYKPTYEDIRDYWSKCSALAITEIEQGHDADKYVEIVAANIHHWCRHGLTRYALPLIEKVALIEENGWKILENDYNHIIGTLSLDTRNKDVASRFESLKAKIVLNDLPSRLRSLQNDYYEATHAIDNPDAETDFYLPIANEFLDKGWYKDASVLKDLVAENQFVFFPFCDALARRISDAQLSEMLNAILASDALADGLVSPFLFTFISFCRRRQPVEGFLTSLIQQNLDGLFTALSARIEDDRLSRLKSLDSIFKEKPTNYFPIYLRHVSLSHESLGLLLPVLAERADKNLNEVISFLVIHYQFVKIDEEARRLCREIVLKFDFADASHSLISSYCRYISHLLKEERDEAFAMEIAKKLLSASDEAYDTHSFTTVFKTLLHDYRDICINPLLEAMMDETFFSVPYRLSSDLGSGFGFGAGEFFSLQEEYLMSQLDTYGVKLARTYARICPVFSYDDRGGISGFSGWVLTLLDRYGMDKEMLDNLSINMGSFAWSGSIIPLYDAKIRSLTNIAGHKHEAVRTWVQTHLERLSAERQQEIVREDFQSRAY